MGYPPAVLEKAQRLEQLLQRVATGEPLDEVNEALGFNLDQHQLAHWQAKYEAGGCTQEALIDGRHGHPRKAHSALREWLYARKQEDEELRAPQLVSEIKDKFGVKISDGHINYLLRKRGLSAPPSRPAKKQYPAEEDTADSSEWLLESDNPWVHCFRLTEILEQPEDDSEVEAAKKATRSSDSVTKVLAAQYLEGYWIKLCCGYSPKYRTAVWQFMFLADLGAIRTEGIARSRQTTWRNGIRCIRP